ncbi:hypothetical protein ACHAWC_003144 [Mediolabrus comicus]
MPPTKIKNAKVVSFNVAWHSFHFNVPNFKDLPTTRDHYVETPLFTCNGHEWDLRIYPGGDDDAPEGFVSIDLFHQSEGSITANYEVMIIDKFGKKKEGRKTTDSFEGMGHGFGWRNVILRSDILDESKNILDSDGTLTVGVSMKEESSTVFVPKNPLLKTIRRMFLGEDTADLCFEFRSADAKKGKKKRAKILEKFHAHSLILKTGAPMLANLFDLDDRNYRNGKLAKATITDVKADIFRHLLFYVYGGSVPEEELKTHAKDIIDAAYRYSIVNLKLEAEAAYVKSTKITMDNVMDNLLYADAKNCALLKEAVMNFLSANHYEASEKISFNDNVPEHLMKDLLVAVGSISNSKKVAVDELSTLSVSDLRRKLAEKGLDVDGSREAMIESIKDNATDSD